GGSPPEAAAGPTRRAGSAVLGKESRSGRHHNRTGRNEPRGVPPSPSRLLALIPPRPSATGTHQEPARRKPCDGRPGRGLTWMVATDDLRIRSAAEAISQLLLALVSLHALLRPRQRHQFFTP